MMTNKIKSQAVAIISLFVFIVFLPTKLISQEKIKLEEILLMDTVDYVSFNTERVYDKNYSPENLFDGDMNTCWVAGSAKNPVNSSLFIQLPGTAKPILNIFPGYGKSKALYKQNARPKEIKLTIYPAYSWGGFAFNYGLRYLAAKFPFEVTLHIPDTFELRSIPLEFPTKRLEQFKKKVREKYKTRNEFPLEISTLILRIEILESYPGSKYDDICISELFLSDRFVPNRPTSYPPIEKVYENADQNAILLDDTENNEQMVFKDTSKIVQLLEVSADKKWAIILTMPKEIEGRAETIYHLLDLVNRKEVTNQIERITRVPIDLGMTFETGKYGKL